MSEREVAAEGRARGAVSPGGEAGRAGETHVEVTGLLGMRRQAVGESRRIGRAAAQRAASGAAKSRESLLPEALDDLEAPEATERIKC
jgi:hypothetical protein